MALARMSADKFVLLVGDSARHPDEPHSIPFMPPPDTVSLFLFERPTSVPVRPCSLFERVHPGPGSVCTKPFYDAIAPTIEDPVARVLHHARRAQGVRCESRRVLVVLTSDSSFIDALWFFQTSDMIGREK